MKEAEKSLNLCELLKGCEGEDFYSPFFGWVLIHAVLEDKIQINCCEWIYDIPSNGIAYPGGEVMLLPSKEQRDWNVWKEFKKE